MGRSKELGSEWRFALRPTLILQLCFIYLLEWRAGYRKHFRARWLICLESWFCQTKSATEQFVAKAVG